MPTEPRIGLRVRHAVYGPGTITAHADGAVSVEHDDADTVRRYVLALGTLATEDGDTLTAATPNGSELPSEHPPTDQVHRRPRALRVKVVKQFDDDKPKDHRINPPTEIIPMPDTLLQRMNAAIAERGKGAGAALCATLGLAGSSYKNWRVKGSIPTQHHAGIEAWITKPTITAIRVTKTKVKTAKLHLVKIPKVRDLQPPPIRSAIDHTTVIKALGLTITNAWIQDGDTMRKVRAVVLP
jgi:hypothetical protein